MNTTSHRHIEAVAPRGADDIEAPGGGGGDGKPPPRQTSFPCRLPAEETEAPGGGGGGGGGGGMGGGEPYPPAAVAAKSASAEGGASVSGAASGSVSASRAHVLAALGAESTATNEVNSVISPNLFARYTLKLKTLPTKISGGQTCHMLTRGRAIESPRDRSRTGSAGCPIRRRPLQRSR